jgi:hypothetical protein
MTTHLQNSVIEFTNYLNLSKDDYILEIGANDGTCIKNLLLNGYKNIIGIVYYNLNEIFDKYDEIKTICHDDFLKIKKCILTNKISQKGQQYIHLHKHGSKNSETRAFFTNNMYDTNIINVTNSYIHFLERLFGIIVIE